MDVLSKIPIVRYGVLGTHLGRAGLETQAPPPDGLTAFVDPAGLGFIQHGPRGAGGASGFIYKHIRINRAASFPDGVKEAITEECHAKYHAYGDGEASEQHHVIHTVGPRLGFGQHSFEEATAALAPAYQNVMLEFLAFAAAAAARADGKPVTLRLLPISGGIFAGEYNSPELIAPLSVAALRAGLELLPPAQRASLLADGVAIELCVFMGNELHEFRKAMAQARGEPEPEPEPEPESEPESEEEEKAATDAENGAVAAAPAASEAGAEAEAEAPAEELAPAAAEAAEAAVAKEGADDAQEDAAAPADAPADAEAAAEENDAKRPRLEE